MSQTIHLVYPYGPGIAAPDVIGRRLGAYLSNAYDVVHHEWDSFARIRPHPGDILLGHPHPVPGTIFRRSFRDHRWSRRLVLSPFNGDPRQVAFLDPFVTRADAYLAITGPWWFRRVAQTPMAHWAPRMIQLDLAIELEDFPRLKHGFAPPGRRRILYVGHSGWQKNVGYLSQIARALPEWDFGWIGAGAPTDILGVTPHGVRDTRLVETRELISTYDLMLTVGRADANPITVLEAMSWGLLPVCTPQSGYVDEPGIRNVPLDDVRGAVAVLEDLQAAPAEELLRLQQLNLERLRTHYTWDRFGSRVEDALDSGPMPALARQTALTWRLAIQAAVSPYGPLGPQGRRLLVTSARGALERWGR